LDGRCVIGEGGAELLRAVEVRGSLAQGAREIGWSYRHAWGYVRRAEKMLGVAFVSTKPSKGSARGTIITDAARDIVATLLRESATSHRSPTSNPVAISIRERLRSAPQAPVL